MRLGGLENQMKSSSITRCFKMKARLGALSSKQEILRTSASVTGTICFDLCAGTKSMESWGGKGEGSVAASRHPSWDEEEDGGGGGGGGGGGVWNSTGSQGSSSSFNSGGWGQPHGGKRGNIKVRGSRDPPFV